MDASFSIDWLLADESSSLNGAMATAFAEGPSAPVIFWHEVGSGLRSLALRRRIERSLRNEMLAKLRRLDVRLDRGGEIEQVLAISDQFSLTVYDAAYLELALRTGGRLATTDGGLLAAARRGGVSLAEGCG